MIDAATSGGGFSLVELLGEEEVFATVGDLIFKPRDQWHTFWNAGDSPARVLEIICPGGLEELFRVLGLMTSEPEPEEMAGLARDHGCDVDFERTGPLMERHGLSF